MTLLMSACAAPAAPTQVALPPMQSATPAATASPQPIPTVTLLPTVTATLPVCEETIGKVKQQQFESAALGEPFTFTVYTPPCYQFNGQGDYPVLYMLHGQTSTDAQWVDLGLTDAADRLIASGELPPFLIVMPFEKDNLQHPFTTGFEEALPDELLPWIDANYATCPERQCRFIGGLSRGGSWALRFGLSRWELFSAIGGHSIPVFTGDPGHLPQWVAEIEPGKLPRIWIDIGESDPYRQPAEELDELLTKMKIAHEWRLRPGNHNDEYWNSHVEEYLRWYFGE